MDNMDATSIGVLKQLTEALLNTLVGHIGLMLNFISMQIFNLRAHGMSFSEI